MNKIIRPVRGGQITIPAQFRAKLGIEPETLLQVTLLQGELRIRPLNVRERVEGSPWLKELYDLFAPVRRETKKYSEEEINKTIGKAVKAVRKAHG